MAAPACGACLHEPPPYERTVCALDYGFPWRALIGSFKFEGAVELARPLAERLIDAVQTAAAEPPDCVLPVPLSRSRLAERGFNQAWELARRVAGSLRLPAHAGALLRAIDTPHQAGLERRARLSNLHGAFTVAAPYRPRLAGQHVALLDDVMTTGATLAAATAALRRAGVARVQVWVLARTPAPAAAET
jgi:ComF family protein